MKGTISLLTGIVFCGVLAPTSLRADDRRPSIDRREHHQQVRINQGIRSGELTRQEARRLEAEQARIRVNERFARRGGFTPEERRRIQNELNKASRDIDKQKHDRQDR
jgi:hypothetical protein